MADRIWTADEIAQSIVGARAFRRQKIINRRKMNAMARSRGFRNYAAMSEYVA